jgi:XTP/dITP diphosphohydrolase
MRKLIIASNNEGKCKEIKDILRDLPFCILSLKDIGLHIQVEEDQHTFEGNATKKAFEIMKACGEIALADDSGLEVAALAGKPGVYSAMFAGNGATDEENYSKLLTLMKDIPTEQRKASFCCVIAVAYPDERIIYAKESCDGRIAFSPEGANGFGYDPIFIPDDYNMTFAQLGQEVKNQISHRGKALRKMEQLLKQECIKDGSLK